MYILSLIFILSTEISILINDSRKIPKDGLTSQKNQTYMRPVSHEWGTALYSNSDFALVLVGCAL